MGFIYRFSGIYVRGSLRGTPVVNMVILLIGTIWRRDRYDGSLHAADPAYITFQRLARA